MHSHSSTVKNGYASYVLELGESSCNELHKTQTFTHLGVVISQLKMNSTSLHLATVAGSVDYGSSCQGSHYEDQFGEWTHVVVHAQYEVHLSTAQASLYLDENKLVTNTGFQCVFTEGYCFDIDQGEVICDILSSSPCESKRYSVLYEGLTSKIQRTNINVVHGVETTVIVEEGDTAFALRLKNPTVLCYQRVFSTEHPKLFVAFKQHGDFILSCVTDTTTDIDMFAYLNSKFIYVERHITVQIVQMYLDIIHQECENERKSLQIMITQAMSNPVEFAYDYYHGPGYTAIVKGEVIYLVKCHPTPVTIRETQKCYNSLPVLVNNQSMFLTPRTRIMTPVGEEVECISAVPSGFFILGKWYFSQSKLIHQEAPNEVRPNTRLVWHYNDAHELAKSGIYSDQELEKLRKQLLAPITKEAITSVISQVLDGSSIAPTDLSFHKLIDQASLEVIASDILDKFWGWMRFVGNWTSGCIGVYVVWKFLKYLFDVILNTKILYDMFGWSISLVASVSTAISKYIIHRRQLNAQSPGSDELKASFDTTTVQKVPDITT
jgi:hypothetical protein